MGKSLKYAIEHNSPDRQSPAKEKSQSQRFIETAKELGCDESEAEFEQRLRRIASAPPSKKK